MKRREFLRSTAALTAITAMPVGGGIRSAGAQGTSALVSDPGTPAGARAAAAPAPISESEREERRENARKLMSQLGFSAMLIEPGANMNYFAGIDWGRSERLFAFLLPVSGKPVVISPAFEQQRAEDQVNGRYDVRVWQEDENPEVLVADTLRDLGLATGRLAVDPSARTFVFTELAQARPGMQFGVASLII